MKRLRTFQSTLQEDDGEVKMIIALLKSCTQAEVCAEAMGGGRLCVGKANLPRVLRRAGLQPDQAEPVREEERARGNHWLLGPSEHKQLVKTCD